MGHGLPRYFQAGQSKNCDYLQTSSDNLRARKNKERAVRFSSYIARWEDNIAGANVDIGLQSLLNEVTPDVAYE